MSSNEENAEGGISICNEEIKSDEEEGVLFYEKSYFDEDLGNDDEVTDAVGIGGGSEKLKGVKEELERSGMGSDEILEYTEEICNFCFRYI